MKIILSRKGFDSGYGGVPSPVLPDGRVLSLPIPSVAGIPLGECQADGIDLARLVSDLTSNSIDAHSSVHLDPDLTASSLPRADGWRAAFGQVGAAQGHLSKNSVGRGDLFLFFGWFRAVEQSGAGWRYTAQPSFHGLFGWLKVGDVLAVETSLENNLHPSMADHPHVRHAKRFLGQRNTLYVADRKLQGNSEVAGAGAFGRWSPKLRLTTEGERLRSNWTVPAWMHPEAGRPALTYHGDVGRWTRDGAALRLRSVAKGQEFILDADHYPEASDWAYQLIREHA